jgi:integrase
MADFLKTYEETYGITHRGSALAFVAPCVKNLVRLLGSVILPDLTEDKILQYMKTRQSEGAAGRTINAELGVLSRAIGRPWSYLWPRVRKLEERHDVGKALSPEQERALLAAADRNRSPNVRTMVRVSLLTGLRAGELSNLTWGRVDFADRTITVGAAKTEAGRGRQIPMNADLQRALSDHAEWFRTRFGEGKPEHFVFPWGSPLPSDPARPSIELKTAWDSIRSAAGVECRWHDLRHTVCTKMAEAGVPESTMLAIMGHMSRAMLERYSHIRMAAKREAVESLCFTVGDSLGMVSKKQG